MDKFDKVDVSSNWDVIFDVGGQYVGLPLFGWARTLHLGHSVCQAPCIRSCFTGVSAYFTVKCRNPLEEVKAIASSKCASPMGKVVFDC